MQNPVPDEQELNDAYSVANGYACYRPAWKQRGWPLWKILRVWTTRRRVALLKRCGTGKTLLEIGCGAGDFLLAARHAGWQVKAVEYNSTMVEQIVSELGCDVRVGELAPGLWVEGQFDTVAFWNVLEHVPDPLRNLTLAAAYLRPRGRLILNIPTRQAAEHGLRFGQYWALLDLPRHLNFFDEATLSRLCDTAGLDLLLYKTPFIQSAWSYYMSSWIWSNRDGRKGLRWLRFLPLVALVSMMMPYVAIEALRKHGMEATVVAVKR
jgi:SAM-dependent methyltransferase